MKSAWSHSLRMSLCAAAVCIVGAAHAQTTTTPAAPPGSAGAGPVTAVQPAAQASAPAPAASQASEHHGKMPAHMHHKSNTHKEGDRHPGQRGNYATPQAHEAAAVRVEERSGRLSRGATTLDQYQRNALARCDVFRDPEDHRACTERMRSAEVTGSVEGGGLLRELTEQVPVQP